jgi:SNF2 family DNA or RNA helicase
MLEEIMEEAQGSPVLVIYNFTSDVDRITKRLSRFKPHKSDGPESVRRWNRGEIPLMLLHSSGGIGINLQQGGYNLVWFGLPGGLEAYQQTCKRLHRMGQVKRVNNYVLLCPGTLEYKVAQRLKDKALTQDDLMLAIKAEVYELRQ